MRALPNRWLFGSAALLILGAGIVSRSGNLAEVATLHRFWLGVGIMGAGFALTWRGRDIPPVWFWGVAIVTRLVLLPMQPGDDVWRYLWEGQIQTLGFSPYHFAPNAPELEPYRPIWWSQINHADVTAIYPPLTQLGFRLLASIAPNLYLFKVAFTIADLLTGWLLCRRFGYARSTLYAWNPMIIYAFAGGAHYDSWFILPLVAAGLQFDQKPAPCLRDRLWSAGWIGISIAIKWMSFPVLGFLIWRSIRQFKPWVALWVGILGTLPMMLAALPFCRADSCPLIPTGSVFVSHGRSTELIPHFVGQIWPASLQTNAIYLLPLGLWVIGLTLRTKTFQSFTAAYWFGLLTLSPIVHFWYFTWIVPFAVATQNWGVRLVSLSAFVYFVLPSRLPDWRLTIAERLVLWLPFLLGWLWTKFDSPDADLANSQEKFNP